MIGIYKITNPSGRVYIGQSCNLKDRYRKYKQLACKSQFKLYASFLKYGFDAHAFEIINLCEKERLDELERHYIKVYKSYPHGLNANDGSSSMSNEGRKRVSIANSGSKHWLGKKHSEETKKKISESHKGKKREPFSVEWVEKIRLANIGRKNTPESIEKMKIAQKNRDGSTYAKMSYACRTACLLANKKRKGIPRTEQEKINIRNGQPKNPVIDNSTGIIYQTIRDASVGIGMNYNTLVWYMSGRTENKTEITRLKYFKQLV